MSMIENHFSKYFNKYLWWSLSVPKLFFELLNFIYFGSLNVLHDYWPSAAQMDFIFRDMQMWVIFKQLSRSLCIYDLWLEIQLFDQRILKMLIKLSEIDAFKFVPLAQVVSKIDKLLYYIQIIFCLHPQLRELKFHSHFFSCPLEPCSVNLRETCSSNSFLIELAEYIFQLALEVIFINDFDLFEWKCGTLILKDLEHFNVLFRRDSF